MRSGQVDVRQGMDVRGSGCARSWWVAVVVAGLLGSSVGAAAGADVTAVDVADTDGSVASSTAMDPPASEDPDAVRAEAAALAEANRTGEPQEVLADRDAFSQTFANPGGTFTQETSLIPRWGKDDNGGWAAVNTTLTPRDGRWEPKVPGAAVSFAADGDDARLVTVGTGAESVSLSPLGDLRAALHGKTSVQDSSAPDSVVFAGVFTGVDLRLTATPEGIRQVFVVSQDGAEQLRGKTLDFSWSGHGLRLSRDSSGGLRAVDGNGNPALSAPPPVMWDSSTAPAKDEDSGAWGQTGASGAAVGEDQVSGSAGETPQVPAWQAPGAGAVTAPIGVEVEGSTVSLTPDPRLLDGQVPQGITDSGGRKAAYPLYLDPSLGLENPKRLVLSNKVAPIWGFSGSEGVGYCTEDPRCRVPHVKRMFFQFGRQDSAGKRVLTAVFRAKETWSWSCTPSVVDLHLVDKAITSTLAWGTRPGSVKRLGSRNVSAGRGSDCRPSQPAKWVDFRTAGLTTAVRQLAAGSRSRLTLMLRARNENAPGGWKKFGNDALLRVVYANNPLVPDLTGVKTEAGVRANCSSATQAAQGKAVTMVTDRPTLMARVKASPGAGALTRAEYQVERGPAQLSAWSDDPPTWAGRYPSATSADPWIAAGSKTQIKQPALSAAGLYRMRARTVAHWSYTWLTAPYEGELYSAYSSWCYYRIDVDAPAIPTVVSGGPYLECSDTECVKAGGPEVAGTFTFTANRMDSDVRQFAYQLLGPGQEEHTLDATKNAGAAGATVTVSLKPGRYGRTQLQVWALDGGGKSSEPYTFEFAVKAAAEPVALWQFADAAGSTTAADSATEGTTRYPLTLGGASPAAGKPVSPGARWDGRGRRGDVPGDRALALDGAGAFAQTSGAVTSAARSFTVSAWVYRTSADANGVVLSQSANTAASAGWALYYSSAYRGWVFAWHAADATGTIKYTRSRDAQTPIPEPEAAPPVGTWTHVAGVYDAQSQGEPTIQLFVNGRAQSTPVPVIGARDQNIAGSLQIGRFSSAQTTTTPKKPDFIEYLAGRVDEAQVWARALSATEVRDDAELMISNPAGDRDRHTALVGDWWFTQAVPGDDQDTITTVEDSSGYAHPHAALAGGARVGPVASRQAAVTEEEDPIDALALIEDVVVQDEAAGESQEAQDVSDGVDPAPTAQDSGEQALVLNGTRGYAHLNGPVVDDSASFTVSAEVRLNPSALATRPVGYRAQVLGQQSGAAGGESSWTLWWETTGIVNGVPQGFWEFERSVVDSTGAVSSRSGSRQISWVPAGAPTTLSGVYDAHAGQVQLYVNSAGQPAGSVGVSAATGSGEFSVGRGRRGGAWTDYFPGEVFRVRVWAGAMNTDQVGNAVQGSPAS